MFYKVDDLGLLMALYNNGDEKWAHFTHKKVLDVVGDVYKQVSNAQLFCGATLLCSADG